MAEHTEISWADATFNPWIGCTRISPACDHCYAAAQNEFRKWVPGWGTSIPRRRTKTWGDPVRWNRDAALTGRRPRIFCASLADVFDNEVHRAWHSDLWQLIKATPNLRWMLLTKRIGNASKTLPPDWPQDFLHVGLMATIANQDEWDRDYHKLTKLPAAWRGVSAEPLLGPIKIPSSCPPPDWLIVGGESGAHHRPPDPEWVRSLRDQCAELAIAFHFKQWGGMQSKSNGCLLDGCEHKAFPKALAA
jgi:protein gp37